MGKTEFIQSNDSKANRILFHKKVFNNLNAGANKEMKDKNKLPIPFAITLKSVVEEEKEYGDESEQILGPIFLGPLTFNTHYFQKNEKKYVTAIKDDELDENLYEKNISVLKSNLFNGLKEIINTKEQLIKNLDTDLRNLNEDFQEQMREQIRQNYGEGKKLESEYLQKEKDKKKERETTQKELDELKRLRLQSKDMQHDFVIIKELCNDFFDESYQKSYQNFYGYDNPMLINAFDPQTQKSNFEHGRKSLVRNTKIKLLPKHFRNIDALKDIQLWIIKENNDGYFVEPIFDGVDDLKQRFAQKAILKLKTEWVKDKQKEYVQKIKNNGYDNYHYQMQLQKTNEFLKRSHLIGKLEEYIRNHPTNPNLAVMNQGSGKETIKPVDLLEDQENAFWTEGDDDVLKNHWLYIPYNAIHYRKEKVLPFDQIHPPLKMSKNHGLFKFLKSNSKVVIDAILLDKTYELEDTESVLQTFFTNLVNFWKKKHLETKLGELKDLTKKFKKFEMEGDVKMNAYYFGDVSDEDIQRQWHNEKNKRFYNPSYDKSVEKIFGNTMGEEVMKAKDNKLLSLLKELKMYSNEKDEKLKEINESLQELNNIFDINNDHNESEKLLKEYAEKESLDSRFGSGIRKQLQEKRNNLFREQTNWENDTWRQEKITKIKDEIKKLKPDYQFKNATQTLTLEDKGNFAKNLKVRQGGVVKGTVKSSTSNSNTLTVSLATGQTVDTGTATINDVNINVLSHSIEKIKSVKGVPDKFVAERRLSLNCFKVNSVENLERGMHVYHFQGYDGYFDPETTIDYIDKKRNLVFVSSFLSEKPKMEITKKGEKLLQQLKSELDQRENELKNSSLSKEEMKREKQNLEREKKQSDIDLIYAHVLKEQQQNDDDSCTDSEVDEEDLKGNFYGCTEKVKNDLMNYVERRFKVGFRKNVKPIACDGWTKPIEFKGNDYRSVEDLFDIFKDYLFKKEKEKKNYLNEVYISINKFDIKEHCREHKPYLFVKKHPIISKDIVQFWLYDEIVLSLNDVFAEEIDYDGKNPSESSVVSSFVINKRQLFKYFKKYVGTFDNRELTILQRKKDENFNKFLDLSNDDNVVFNEDVIEVQTALLSEYIKSGGKIYEKVYQEDRIESTVSELKRLYESLCKMILDQNHGIVHPFAKKFDRRLITTTTGTTTTGTTTIGTKPGSTTTGTTTTKTQKKRKKQQQKKRSIRARVAPAPVRRISRPGFGFVRPQNIKKQRTTITNAQVEAARSLKF